MNDLDWSDVVADGERMFDEFLVALADADTVSLQVNRYDYGPDARRGDPHAIAVVETCDYLIPKPCYREFGDHDHDVVECSRILHDMSGGDDGSWYADALNREAEENMLGRPLFPNEY